MISEVGSFFSFYSYKELPPDQILKEKAIKYDRW